MNYKEYGGGYQEDTVTANNDVVVENYTNTEKEQLTQAMDNVIDSLTGVVTDDDIIEEVLQSVEFDDESLKTLGEESLASKARRMLGSRKRKGHARLVEANPQPEFGFIAKIPLHDHAQVPLSEDESIPLNKAKKEHIQASHVYYTARSQAKIEEIQNNQRQLTSSVGYLKDNMDDQKSLEDYDNGEGVAEI